MPVSWETRYPKSPVFYRRLKRDYPRVVRGEGVWLHGADGERWLDACSGAYVVNVGHGVSEIAEAVAEQAKRVAYVNGTAFTHDPVEELASEIAGFCPKPLDKTFFLCSGTDVVEAAFKLARQHFAETGRPKKNKIVSLSPSYHGNTILSLSASARPAYKKHFEGWLVDFPSIQAPYPYRFAPEHPSMTGDALEEKILEIGAENIAAFIGEPVGGSSTGASVPQANYWKRVREICDKHEIFWIADEVLTGIGRTGYWSALEPYGAVPDMILFGKGLTGGYAALSALVTHEDALRPIAAGTGALLHNATFSHSALGCAAGVAALRYIKENDLIARAKKTGETLHAKLAVLRERPEIGDVRGRGMLAGIEFVKDKASKTPFPRELKFAETFCETAQAAGLVVWQSTAGADGVDGDFVMIAPPFAIADAEIDEILARFTRTLDLMSTEAR
jgi:adenosylmethionine-8-amino-7-oxononanoate aminotransferase